MSFGLLQIKESAKISQIGRGGQELGDVTKRCSVSSFDVGNLVSPFFHFGTVPFFKEIGYQVALQENVIVAGAEKIFFQIIAFV